MNVSGLVAIVLWSSFLCMAQEVHVSQGKNSVVLSVSAQKPYPLMSGEENTARLSVECAQKGKKAVHLLKFSPGGSLVEDNPEKGAQLTFNMTIGGVKQSTTWVNYGDAITFTHLAKDDPERLRFIQSLLSSGSVAIEFIPFLTGAATTSVFDLRELRDKLNEHPECATK
jgi:hypothetical protein